MYEFDSRVRYSEVDAAGELTLLALMDYFQDCSVFHSEQLNIGISYLTENHMAWVLSSWQICLNRMPRLAEYVKIQTWPYGMKGFYGYRNFSMNDEFGQRLAYANSVWVLIDTRTGRPMRVPEELPEIYGLDEPLPMETSGRKIAVPTEYEQRDGFAVPAYFIDTNQHMNNSRYVQVAEQFVPEGAFVREVRVEYRKVAKQAEILNLRVTRRTDGMIVVFCAPDGAPYAIVDFLLGA